MKRKIFRHLITKEEANELFYKHLPDFTPSVEHLRIEQAINRVLAEDIISKYDIPPFDRASMDGFAVISKDTIGAGEDKPVNLKIIRELKAGYVFEGIVSPGECVEISTGAPMPSGANSVVMIEYCVKEDELVKIYRSVTPFENTMSAGADIQMGERVVSFGTVLTSRELAVLAAIGVHEVPVFKKPKIGLFSSGDEIIAPNEPLMPGKLFDINSYSIATSILENGGDPKILGILADKRAELTTALETAINEFDVVIISGGTSAGMGDMLYEIIDELGEPGLLVHGIKVKPGKPTILAVCNGVPVIGLPGYPASALSIYQLFVLPLVRSWSKLPPLAEGSIIKAKTNQRLRSVEGRHEFKPMYIIKGKDEWIAYPVPGGSGAITSVAHADGFVQIPENTHFIPAQSEILIQLISSNIRIPDIQIVGSHDVAMVKLQQLFESRTNYKVRSVSAGSSGGVAAIRRGEAHIAGIHLFDGEKGYNKWVLEDLDATLIEGYYRNQGFIVKKGNPKQIHKVDDLLKPEISFMNRNAGSGTRVLFDHIIAEEKINPFQINGYERTAKSHSSAAQAVKMGIVDVSIGIEAAALALDLDFVPLKDEEYDLLIHNEFVDTPAVKALIEIFQSQEFRDEVNKMKGYRSKL